MPLTAWVFETDEWPPDDGRRHTGRFSGHVADGPRRYGSVEDVSLEEALAWARSRADKVLVRYGDSDHFSAGVRHPPAAPRRPPADLPPLVRRRADADR